MNRHLSTRRHNCWKSRFACVQYTHTHNLRCWYSSAACGSDTLTVNSVCICVLCWYSNLCSKVNWHFFFLSVVLNQRQKNPQSKRKRHTPHFDYKLRALCTNHTASHNLKVHTSAQHAEHAPPLLTNTLKRLALETRLPVGLSAPDSHFWRTPPLEITSWSCSLQSSSPQQHSSVTGYPRRHLSVSLELHGTCSSSVSSVCVLSPGQQKHRMESWWGWRLSTYRSLTRLHRLDTRTLLNRMCHSSSYSLCYLTISINPALPPPPAKRPLSQTGGGKKIALNERQRKA